MCRNRHQSTHPHSRLYRHLISMSTEGKAKYADRNKIQIHMQTHHRPDTCIMQAPSSSQTHNSPTQPPRRRLFHTMAKDTPQHTHVPAIMQGQRSCLAVIPTKTFLKTSLWRVIRSPAGRVPLAGMKGGRGAAFPLVGNFMVFGSGIRKGV